MSIVLSQGRSKPIRLNRTTIADEAYLQQFISDHPESLPFDQLEEDAAPLVLVREFPTSSGPIDALTSISSKRSCIRTRTSAWSLPRFSITEQPSGTRTTMGTTLWRDWTR